MSGQPDPRDAHRLGSATRAAARVATALDRACGPAESAQVPLAVLGAAVAAPTGGPYRDDDGGDRALLVRLLAAFTARLAVAGWTLGELPDPCPPGAAVQARRSPPVARPKQWRGWPHIATDVELDRWAARARGRPEPTPDLAAVLYPSAGEAGRVRVARARAGARTWPPPILGPSGQPVEPVAPSRPLVVRGGLTPPTGCTRGTVGHPGCVAAPGGRWTCSRCGTVTLVRERLPGLRLPVCTCWEALCVHPLPAQAAPVRRAR